MNASPSRHYTVSQVHALTALAIVVGVLIGGLFIWMVRDAVDAYRRRQIRHFQDEVRDAKGNVIGIVNQAQTEMIRLLMDGRARRGGG